MATRPGGATSARRARRALAVVAGLIVIGVLGTATPDARAQTQTPAQTPVPAANSADPGRASGVVARLDGSGRGGDQGGSGAGVAAVPAVAVPDANGEYTGIDPFRILDTRPENGGGGPLGPGSTVTLQPIGQAGVPFGGVRAVVLNLTATEPTAASFLAAYPADSARPGVSSLNFGPGQTVANLVTVPVSFTGEFTIYNDGGSVHVVVDLLGYYSSSGGPAGGRYHPVGPNRVADTRLGSGGVPQRPVSQGATLGVNLLGAAGLPGAGAEYRMAAVTLNVTVTEPTHAGFVTVFPGDRPVPHASTLNFVAGESRSNLVTVRLPADGWIGIYNNTGRAQVVVDVLGWYDLDRRTETGRFVAVAPERLLDTREALPMGPVSYRALPVTGRAGIPRSGAGSVVANVTVTGATEGGYVTVFPTASALPSTSTVNFPSGATIPNLTVADIGRDGNVAIYNNQGLAQVIVDVAGFFTEVTYAFDTCETPSLAAMQTWRNASPYSSIGIYIGGSARACANRALDNPTWFNSVVAQGWRVIPIYVGPQAPCAGFRSSIDPANAFWSGVAAAEDAINQALEAGLPVGSPLYYDMEAYDNRDAGCSQAVKDFMQGWIIHLHNRGFLAGFYSSFSSGIADMRREVDAGRVPLDAIWIAAWNDRPNVTGFDPAVLPDSYWSGFQRLHQYQGDHVEEWGGVRIAIDTNVVYGPLAP